MRAMNWREERLARVKAQRTRTILRGLARRLKALYQKALWAGLA